MLLYMGIILIRIQTRKKFDLHSKGINFLNRSIRFFHPTILHPQSRKLLSNDDGDGDFLEENGLMIFIYTICNIFNI